ncbi:receptor-like protein kinase THESEUS 1 [Andrographis paniculata]|uniref:receptor-like protein kinase THESEUS 1 n=1 Tax=Andrographis paniculata TaxID=175694 RepID=UPI0021E78B4C|nr:receptor-like protein kinase THESEUS 1 [Andrographis paniculata]XP_051128030.1 receptor-like protein kinase THESEUS 1 [Andrographis paniculata]XP_051128031.1 receptor-like protein kinase THESEUS 1 [Andrographis paniculata]XP_051128032.1 receptor-like protein kinase THESEUS 1 [Andrographis paniculata]
MGSSLAAVVGGVGGGLILILVVAVLVWFFRSKFGQFSNRGSETFSSDTSVAATATMKRSGATGSYAVPRQFRFEELEQATKNFDESNLIGCGTFGLVYKGLLADGTFVAIKRRAGHPQLDFTEEVAHLSTIQHRNVVKLLGYCQERGSQILVFEYLPNGSMCSHLYGAAKESNTKLEFKQRLNIATAAAKGLSHLHGLQPPVIHGNFKTANVLVDEDFVTKVSDAGVKKLLERIDDAGSSTSASIDAFRDPELGLPDTDNEINDIYSYGIFLLELISGKEAANKEAFRSNDGILQWVQECLSSDNLIDRQLAGSFTPEGMKDVIKVMLQCMRFPGRERPRMENVVVELEQILEKEMTRTTVMGEGTMTVIPGSELFTN